MAAPQSKYNDHGQTTDGWAETTTTSPRPSHISIVSPFTPDTPFKTPISKQASADNAQFQSVPVHDAPPEVQWESGPGHRRVLSIWKWELASLAVAIGLMGAIIGLLAQYNGQEVSKWHLNMNLSTLVALLSTVIRANIVVIVSSVISQVKWSWFSTSPRPLQHLQDFDSGSRTVVGSVRLIWMLARRARTAALLATYAIVAALVVVLSFVVGPFMQQAIKTETCLQVLPNVNSSIPVSNYYEGHLSRLSAGFWDVGFDVKGTMIHGLTNPQSHDLEVKAFCPSGNCTFPDYGTGVTHASMGMCSRCMDRTADIEGPDEDGNITVSTGSSSPESSIPWINLSSGQPFLNLAAIQPDMGLVDVTFLAASNSPCTNTTAGLVCPHSNTTLAEDHLYGGVADAVAATCTLYPCIKEYNGGVSNGNLLEHVVATTEVRVNMSDFLDVGNFTALRSPCVLDETGVWYTQANVSLAPKRPARTWDWFITSTGENITVPNACLYKFDPYYAKAVSDFIQDGFLEGFCTYDTRQGEDLWCQDSWWLSPLFNQRNASFGSLERAMDNFANAVTSKLRTTGWGPDEARIWNQWQGVGYGVKGAVLQDSICMSLDWRWLLLPVGLLAVSAVLLAWVMARSYGTDAAAEPLWKSNVLPLVMYGLAPGAGDRKMRRRDTTLSGVQAEAEEIVVQFAVRKDGPPGFVGGTAAEKGALERRYSVDSLLMDRDG